MKTMLITLHYNRFIHMWMLFSPFSNGTVQPVPLTCESDAVCVHVRAYDMNDAHDVQCTCTYTCTHEAAEVLPNSISIL